MAFDLQNIINTAATDTSKQSIGFPSDINTPAPTNQNIIDTDTLEAPPKAITPVETFSQSSFTPTVTNFQSTEDENTELSTLEKTNDDLMSQLKDSMNSTAERGSFTANAEETAGISTLRSDVTDINNRIRSTELKNRRKIEAIQDAPGLTKAQKNAKINEVTRKQNREVADMEIISLARSNKLSDAQATVDRKVALEFEDREAAVENLKFFFTENKDRMSKVEQRAYEKEITKEERAYQKDRATAQTLEDKKLELMTNAMEAGAGQSVMTSIQGATSMEALLGNPNARTYSKSTADKLSEQLLQAQVDAKNTASTDGGYTEGISPVTGKAFNQDQGNAGLFAVRIDQAEDVISQGREKYLPFVPGFLQTQKRRQFEQAEANFITAVLRRESGASISPEETIEARRIYIPNVTDNDATRALKAQARSTVLQGMISASAGSYDQLSSQTISTDDYLDTVDGLVSNSSNPYGNYINS